MLKNIKPAQLISVAVFFVFITVLPILLLLLPKKSFSETENRYLATFPKLSVEKLADAKFMEGFDKYVSDHFAGRDKWIAGKTNLELAEGKKETGGVYILKNRLIEKEAPPDYKVVKTSIDAINAFAETNFTVPTYVMIAPTAQEVYKSELPPNAPAVNQKAFIDYVYQRFSDKVIGVDVYNALTSAKEEYIYYRNDHHWTSLGAYYAYASFAKRMGLTQIPLGSFDVEHANASFKGTLYSKTLYDGIEADTIDYYHLTNGVEVQGVTVNSGDKTTERDSMYFREYLDQKDKYSSFLGNNQPMVTIKTNAQNSNKLLIIKDSYAHCLAPFLTQHFSEITLLDLRYINVSYEKLLHVADFTQVLFVYNADNFMTDENLKKLNLGN